MTTLFALFLVLGAVVVTSRNPYRRDLDHLDNFKHEIKSARTRIDRGVLTFSDLAITYATRERH